MPLSYEVFVPWRLTQTCFSSVGIYELGTKILQVNCQAKHCQNVKEYFNQIKLIIFPAHPPNTRMQNLQGKAIKNLFQSIFYVFFHYFENAAWLKKLERTEISKLAVTLRSTIIPLEKATQNQHHCE